MRVGIVNSSDLIAENRWDPSFHLTKQSLVEDGSLARATQLMMDRVNPDVPEEERESAAKTIAYDIMMSIPPEIRNKAVKDLVKGNSALDLHAATKSIKEYPFMAVAIAFRDFEAEKHIQEEINRLQTKLDKISGIYGSIKNKI